MEAKYHMLQLTRQGLQLLSGILVPLCFCLTWLFLFALAATLWQEIRNFIQRSQLMHAIPCTHCQFFTQDYRLKCTVKPLIANTEEAIHCSDYQSAVITHL
jgi:hypothetical protein